MNRQQAVRDMWSYLWGYMHASSIDELVNGYDEMTEADKRRNEEAMAHVMDRIGKLADGR